MIPLSAEVPSSLTWHGSARAIGAWLENSRSSRLSCSMLGLPSRCKVAIDPSWKKSDMGAYTPLTTAIEQPQKSDSIVSLPTHCPNYSNLIVVHYHLRPGGVRRIIELALPYIASAAPNPIESVVIA